MICHKARWTFVTLSPDRQPDQYQLYIGRALDVPSDSTTPAHRLLRSDVSSSNVLFSVLSFVYSSEAASKELREQLRVNAADKTAADQSMSSIMHGVATVHTWLEAGECNKKTADTFYSCLQVWAHAPVCIAES